MVPGCYYLYYPMKKINLSKAGGVGRECTFFKATWRLKTACHSLGSHFILERSSEPVPARGLLPLLAPGVLGH